jgi:hypothetical protein
MTSLAAYLATTSWTLSKLESVLGVTLKGKVTAEHKRLAWRLILDADARSAVDRVRLHFPSATVEGIRCII